MALKSLTHEQTQALLKSLGGHAAPGAPATALPQKQTPLDWLLDIADRPRRAIMQTSEALGQGALDIANGHFDLAKTAGDVASAVPRGLFSTAKSDQETFGQEIEHFMPEVLKTTQSHDLARALTGKEYDDSNIEHATETPQYQVIKGITGFVGDVGLDPLAYVPGFDLIKAGKIGVGAARGTVEGGDAAKGILRALAPGTEKMKAKVFGPEDVAPKGPAIADLVGTAAKDAEENVTPATSSAAVQNLVEPSKVVLGPEIAPTSHLLRNSEQAKQVVSFLDTVGDQSAFAQAAGKLTPKVQRVVESTEGTVAAAEKEIAAEADAAIPTSIKFRAPQKTTWAKALATLARENPEDDDILEAATLKIVGGDGKAKYVPIAQAMKTAKSDPRMGAAIDDAYRTWAKHAEDQAAFGRTVDEAGRVADAGPATEPLGREATSTGAGTASPEIAAAQRRIAALEANPVRPTDTEAVQKLHADTLASEKANLARLTGSAGTASSKRVERNLAFLRSHPGYGEEAAQAYTRLVQEDPRMGDIFFQPLEAKTHNGEFDYNRGAPIIRLGAHSDNPIRTLLHELGHYADSLSKGPQHNAGMLPHNDPASEEFATSFAKQRMAADEAAKTTSTLDRVKALLATDEGKFWTEQHIGAAMARNFGNYSDPARFDAMVERVRKIATGDPSIDHMSLLPTVNTPERDLLKHAGLNGRENNPVARATQRREWKTMQAGGDVGVTPGVSDSREVLDAVQKAAGNSATKVTAQFESEKAALQSVRDLLDKDLRIPEAEYRFRSKDGVAAKTAEAEGEGYARRGTRIDSHLQYSLVKRIRKHVERVIDRRYPGVDVQTARKLRAAMELKAQRLAYDTLDGAGAPIAMTYRSKDGVETMASLTKLDVYDELTGSPEGKELLDFLFFGRGSNVADTTFMQGIARLVRGDDMDDVMATITAGTDQYGKAVPNWLAGGQPRVYAQIRAQAQKNGALPPRPAWVRATVPAGTNLNYVAHAEDATAMLRGLLEGNRDAIKELSASNARGLLNKVSEDVATMTKAELSNLNSLLEGDNLASFIVGLRNMPDTVANMARKGSAVPVSAQMTSAAVHEALPTQAYEEAVRTERVAAAAARGPEEHRAAAEANFRAAADAWDGEEASLREALTDTEGVLADDLNLSTKWDNETDRAYGQVARSFLAGFNPARRLFSATYALQGKVDSWRMMHDVGTMQASLLHEVRDQANEANKAFGHLADGKSSYLQLGFKAWQNGVEPENEVAAQAMKAVSRMMDGLAEGGKAPSATRLMNSGIFRTTSNYEYLNRIMARYDGTKGFVFDIERAEQEAIRAQVPLGEAISRQMSEWNVNDVPAFIDSLNQATIKVVSDGAIAERFMAKAHAGGLVHIGKGAPKNYVRVVATGESDLAAFLPKDLHLDKETAFILKRLDSVMRQTTQLGDSPLSKLIKNVFDPALQAWKRAATVLHPGHHVRNDIGDATMQYADAGVRHAAQAQALALRALHGNRGYSGMDTLQAMESLGITALDKGRSVSSGRYGSFSLDDLYRAARERGLLVNTKTIETLEDTGRGGLYKGALRAATFQGENNPIGRVVSGVTEFRDHDAVLRHFIQKVMKANDDGFVDGVGGKRRPGDFNAMFDAVADDVIKAHPNSTALSKFERKYLTRVFPFYTWMRGALPFIINSTARYPGRAMALPRASFGLATSLGVNPQSLTDPFPEGSEDQFPSFIKDQITGPVFRGPGGSYFSLSPGVSQFDVPNTFLENGDPLGAIMGMANPLLKAPLELKTGHTLDTGAVIHDASDYVDGQIPLLQYLANFTGVSPSGSAVSEVTRGGLDAQYQVAKGNKSAGLAQALGATNPNVQGDRMTQNGEAQDQLTSLLNALTGAGIVNDSKKSYQSTAKFERQQAMRPTAGGF